MTRRLLDVAPGVVACVGAAFVGAPPLGAAVAFALYLAGALPARRAAAVALLAAPLVLAAGAPAAGLLDRATWAWALLAVLAATPLLLRLGGGLPWRGALPFVAAPAVVAALLLTPWAPTLVASDVAVRAQVLLLAAATLVLVPALRKIPSPRT